MDTEECLTAAERALAQYDLDGAEGLILSAWPACKDAPGEALHILGVVRARQRRYDEAVEFLRGAAAAEPASLRHHIALGHVLVAAVRFPEAADAYQVAGRIDPKWPGLLLAYSDAAYRAGRHEEAERAARQLIAETPSAEAWDALSCALRGQGKGGEALAAAEEALKLKPKNLNALNSKGAALLLLRRGEEALQVFDALVVRGAYTPVLSLNRGDALALLGRKAEAEAVYAEAARRWPNAVHLHQQLAARR